MERSIEAKVFATTASPDGQFLAAFDGNNLTILSAKSPQLTVKRVITSSKGTIKWSNSTRLLPRILVYNDDCVRLWDLEDPAWTATINNGSGGTGKIVNAEFGRNKQEVLVFSDFGSRVTVWSLITGRNVEIKDPKFPTSRGQAYRKNLGVFAQITRPLAQDILSLHAPNSYKVLRSVTLPTMDAQGLKWSEDERWLVVWDTSSSGQKLYIYTADLNLFRTYFANDASETSAVGIRSIEWSPGGQYLAIGGSDRRVTLLSTKTFSPVIFLEHTSVIQLAKGCHLWQEQVTASSKRSYQQIPQPYSPPTASSTSQASPPKTGISVISFNSSGSMIATKDELTPMVVWIWNLSTLTPAAVLIHHAPVKNVSWHPRNSSLLLISCIQDETVLNLWNANTLQPETIPLSFHKSSGTQIIKWLGDASSNRVAVLVSDSNGSFVVWPKGRHESEQSFDEGSSVDSVYEALVGPTSPQKGSRLPIDHTEVLVSEITEDFTVAVDDTFVNRRQLSTAN